MSRALMWMFDGCEMMLSCPSPAPCHSARTQAGQISCCSTPSIVSAQTGGAQDLGAGLRRLSAAVAAQTLGYLVVLAGFVMAYLMHRASGGAGHEEVFAATPGSSVPLGADSGGLVNNPLVGRRRRLLHEHHDDASRGRVAELHGLVGFVVLGLVTLQACHLGPTRRIHLWDTWSASSHPKSFCVQKLRHPSANVFVVTREMSLRDATQLMDILCLPFSHRAHECVWHRLGCSLTTVEPFVARCSRTCSDQASRPPGEQPGAGTIGQSAGRC